MIKLKHSSILCEGCEKEMYCSIRRMLAILIKAADEINLSGNTIELDFTICDQFSKRLDK